MASVSNVMKITPKPLRIMGSGSHDVEGSVLYYEFGTFSILNAAVTGTLATKLTNIVAAIFTPKNAPATVALPYSDLTIASDGTGITVANTDPKATANFSYLLIGTVETV